MILKKKCPFGPVIGTHEIIVLTVKSKESK
jgi:hypothetical protein